MVSFIVEIKHKKKIVTCFVCNEKGHVKANCPRIVVSVKSIITVAMNAIHWDKCCKLCKNLPVIPWNKAIKNTEANKFIKLK